MAKIIVDQKIPVFYRTKDIPEDATCVFCLEGFSKEERLSGHGAVRDSLFNYAHNRCQAECVKVTKSGKKTSTSRVDSHHKSKMGKGFVSLY